jgi:hypothetical protein
LGRPCEGESLPRGGQDYLLNFTTAFLEFDEAKIVSIRHEIFQDFGTVLETSHSFEVTESLVVANGDIRDVFEGKNSSVQWGFATPFKV